MCRKCNSEDDATAVWRKERSYRSSLACIICFFSVSRARPIVPCPAKDTRLVCGELSPHNSDLDARTIAHCHSIQLSISAGSLTLRLSGKRGHHRKCMSQPARRCQRYGTALQVSTTRRRQAGQAQQESILPRLLYPKFLLLLPAQSSFGRSPVTATRYEAQRNALQ